MIDWILAGQIGGVGFGMVFALLIILAIVVWVAGALFGVVRTTGNGNKKGVD